MVSFHRVFRALRLDLVVGLLVWAGLLVMAHPEPLVEAVGEERLHVDLAFEIGLLVAFVAAAFLALRWMVRLVRIGRRFSFDPALRAVQGTVTVEFALVLPIVLVLLGTVIQIALIAQAAIVVRYAAFVAARAAIVSFEAETVTSIFQRTPSGWPADFQIPPGPEFVDPRRPEQAAHMVLAALSPRGGPQSSQGLRMAQVLEAQGGHWNGGHFAERMAWARGATKVTTRPSRIADYPGSLAPFIPLPTHAPQPARQIANPNSNLAYLLPAPPPLASLVPNAIRIPVNIPIPSPLSLFVPPISFNISIPLPAQLTNVMRQALSPLDPIINALRTGSASAIRWVAQQPWNVDPFSPKEVEVELEYYFQLAIPSLVQLPGVSASRQGFPGPHFLLKHRHYFTARLQSTGGRRTLLGLIPWIPQVFGPVWNTPLYWITR